VYDLTNSYSKNYGAGAARSTGPVVLALIHRSAWKENSRKFTCSIVHSPARPFFLLGSPEKGVRRYLIRHGLSYGHVSVLVVSPSRPNTLRRTVRPSVGPI
jgi:hypothetical protein